MLVESLLAFSPAVVSLVGKASKSPPSYLRDCKGDKLLIDSVIRTTVLEFVAVLAISFAACHVSIRAGVEKGVVVAAFFALFSIYIPRLLLDPALSSLCGECNMPGKLAIGLVCLLSLGVLNYVIVSGLMLGTGK